MLHTADISHPAKAWDLHHRWTMSLLEEFFRQVGTLSLAAHQGWHWIIWELNYFSNSLARTMEDIVIFSEEGGFSQLFFSVYVMLDFYLNSDS